ncbi:unnamed protein product [Dracunculus medinensis]|uniref:PDZ domain-containing protein n=1 Tax=Dracunculus medinensis TaxID=318479 RepID=A0A158Q3L7_DRAME|nr:unnamed protein product [Dracunculus medinensis]
MAQTEMVTVRMSRGQLSTPWGFEIIHPLTIHNIVSGSLADRAGLINGDKLVEFEGHENLDTTLAKQLLSKAQNKIELVIHRDGSSMHRTWKPKITENTTHFNKFQHSVHYSGDDEKYSKDHSSDHSTSVPLKVSLEHQNQNAIGIPGFNVSAQPFGDHKEVKHLQYNSPMPLYSPQSAAEQYLQQTGGLFGTDPNLIKSYKEEPSYLRSETLRLIQENEGKQKISPMMRSVEPPIYNKSLP